ncbi:MAG: Bax inhibitor-1/YccA family protein [Actinomycetota bacterium]|nr:Bax inhibitor-1/YccA family protein [Actinomycetota bacterium]
MASRNPVFGRIEQEQRQGQFATFRTEQPPMAPPGTLGSNELEQMYAAPPATTADTNRLTYDDVIMKTAVQFIVLLAAAAVSWNYVANLPVGDESRGIAIWLVSMFAALGVGLVIAFKKTISVPLILGYAGLEGVFVGAVSKYFDLVYADGIVGQAVIGTLGAFAGMLIAYKVGLIKVNDKFRRIMGFALMGYLAVAVVSFISSFFGVGGGFGFYGVGPLGILLCVAGVGLAAITLALDFDSIDRMVTAGAPAKTAWLLGHGLLVTLVWLYIEILRLLAILRGDN